MYMYLYQQRERYGSTYIRVSVLINLRKLEVSEESLNLPFQSCFD